MTHIPLWLSLLLCPVALSAQGWDWPSEDFDGFYLDAPTRFFNPDTPQFAPDGSVRRPSDPGAPTQFGAFTLLSDGRLCISTGDGDGGCDVYLRDGQMHMLVTEGSERFPFKFELGIGN
ncbi:hypothetical protein [Antarcticimicrobium sediminis]|uniref:Uncharacterized protein n=1 Tax=Antarcticimicrobium sediminis TaxID=2546227 RepID=A0A4R5ES06_9RHOB|nr:hypothetical protein [Antarcticimicrobium sediminis]TDE37410.1 hypothetical protein E1B25_11830 [Antarcticimicrobium sediminis]